MCSSDLSDMFLLFGIVATGYGLAFTFFGNALQLSRVIAQGQLDYYLALPRGVLLNVLGRVVLQSAPEPFVAQVRAILEMPDDMRTELPGLRMPTLVITGSQDALTPMGDAEELAELIPGASLVLLSGAAHGLMAEAPNAYNAAVLRFIDEVEAASRELQGAA